ncbi:unnamed protein product, partial [Iphiclides podalirius]
MWRSTTVSQNLGGDRTHTPWRKRHYSPRQLGLPTSKRAKQIRNRKEGPRLAASNILSKVDRCIGPSST